MVNTALCIPQDTLALKLNGTKAWPGRGGLLHLGREHCRIDDPAPVIDAITDTAAGLRPQDTDSAIWRRVKPELDKGCLLATSPSPGRPRRLSAPGW